MSIRKKMMILLLGIALIPLIVTISMYEISLNIVGKKVSKEIRKTIDENAQYNMQRILQEYEDMLRINGQLLETLVQLQANEVEKVLTEKPLQAFTYSGDKFGQDNRVPESEDFLKKYSRVLNKETSKPINISFRQQDFFLPKDLNVSTLADLNKLSKMTAEYFALYRRNANVIHWQHTSLESGLHTSYPSGATFPDNYDPRKRDWYIGAKKTGSIFWANPYIDAITGEPTLTISIPIYSPNGSMLGVTAIDLLLTDAFQWLELNPIWADNAEGMLISGENIDNPDELTIFAHMNYETASLQWDKPLDFETLKSDDSVAFAELRWDILEGRSGVRRMPYKNQDAVWVYRGFKDKDVYPLLIVPYDNLDAFADETEEYLLKANLEWLQYTAFIVVLVILGVIFISIRRAKLFSEPINNLAMAGKKLSEGNFKVRIDIKTGDELQELGEVFNQMGPKLREHEKMQQSLAVAREIQQKLLPKAAPQIDNFDIAGLCHYSDETGGDYYDFISLDEIEPGKVSIVLGDVTGHGIGAALLMASARSMLRNNVRHYAYDLSKILAEFNNELTVDTDPDKFITLFFGVLDGKKRSLIWALGGHDPAILYRKKSKKIKELKSNGVPLGFVKNMVFEQAGPVKIKAGDIVVVGTDGIWEAEDENEEMFGKDRLIDVIKDNSDKPSEIICKEVINAVRKFSGPRAQADDITVVVIKAV